MFVTVNDLLCSFVNNYIPELFKVSFLILFPYDATKPLFLIGKQLA